MNESPSSPDWAVCLIVTEVGRRQTTSYELVASMMVWWYSNSIERNHWPLNKWILHQWINITNDDDFTKIDRRTSTSTTSSSVFSSYDAVQYTNKTYLSFSKHDVGWCLCHCTLLLHVSVLLATRTATASCQLQYEAIKASIIFWGYKSMDKNLRRIRKV